MFQQSLVQARRLTTETKKMALMNLVFLVVAASVASGAPIYSMPVTYVAVQSIPENIYNQAHDTKTGEYAFGYAGGPVAREESKTSDGVTRGAYSYVDAHGIVQHYRYVADDDGFRVVGTNIPTEVPSTNPIPSEPQLAEAAKTGKIVGKIAALDDKSKESRNRTKRSEIYGDAAIARLEVPLAIDSVPTATSNQNRVQIHEKTVAAVSGVAVAVPAIPDADKTMEVVAKAIPVAIAGSVPIATSSQSRFQIHENLKTEIPVDTEAAVSAVSVAVPAIPDAGKTVEVVAKAIPVAVAGSVPIATSSQSRFQVHETSKIETTGSIAANTVEAVSVDVPVVAVPVATKTIATIPETKPVTVTASLPIATSSQSRVQIHKSLKTEIHEPLTRLEVSADTARGAQSLAAATPVASETMNPIVGHVPIAIASPSLAVVAASNQRLHSARENSNIELRALSQLPSYLIRDSYSADALQAVDLDSSSLVARAKVGVGLGVVPSPVVAYYGPAYLAQA